MTSTEAAQFITEQARRLGIPATTPWRTHKRLAWAAKIEPSRHTRDEFNSDPSHLADWVESACHAILGAVPRNELFDCKRIWREVIAHAGPMSRRALEAGKPLGIWDGSFVVGFHPAQDSVRFLADQKRIHRSVNDSLTTMGCLYPVRFVRMEKSPKPQQARFVLPKPVVKPGHAVHKSYPSREQLRNFFSSLGWKQLRADCFEKHGYKCRACGRNPREHNVILHCDHIIPVSVNPGLMADPNNLQPLCSECNEGKGNRYKTDLR